MSLLKNTAIVGGMTMASRVLGFVRDVLIASVLGTGPVADAFVVAFRFPNLFRRFFAEGAFNAAFVPLYAKKLEGEGEEAAKAFASNAMSGLAFVLLIFTGLALLFMPWFMLLMASGFLLQPGEAFALSMLPELAARLGDPVGREKYDLAVLFTRIAFPYLLFVSLVALLSGVLNSRGRFALAAGAPVLLNVVLIATLVFFAPNTQTPGHALVWGVFTAGLAQFLALVWGCWRAGAMPRFHWPRMTPDMKHLIGLGVPGILAAGITQINLVVGTLIASFEDAAVSILFYADRIYQLPLGLVGAAMGVVLLPDLSRRLRAADHDGAMHVQNRAIELSCLLTLPAAVALFVIPLEIITVLFEHGAFTSSDSAQTAAALAIFALGLPAFVLMKVFQPGYFAREDTKTPMIFAAINALINMTLSYVLFFRIGLVGIAIATTLAGWVNVLLLWGRLWQRKHFTADTRLLSRLPRIVLASLGMGALLWWGRGLLAPLFQGGETDKIFGLVLLVGGGLIAFAILTVVTKASTVSELKAIVRRSA